MIYRLLTILLWPIFLIYTLKISLRDKSLRYLFQRLGFSYPAQKNKTIWIHCASVGEVNTYCALHLQLLQQLPDTHFVITTNTTTGAQTVALHNFKNTQHCYLPVESSFAIKRFIKAWQPSQCLIMETEIWPLLYKRCHTQNIPVSIINARLSHRTLNTNNWIKSLYKTSLTQVKQILCKSEQERENFKRLGAEAPKLKVSGNLKFAVAANKPEAKPVDLGNRNYCVAASTHNNEEQQLATLWKNLHTELLLVIVPRHPNRSSDIQKQLTSLNIKYAVRSQQQAIEADTAIYLADTLGELKQFMSAAEFVFIGGSLVEHGGQNILEACHMGKPTLCGPHMFNFTEELNFLLEQQACIQVNNIKELEKEITDYFISAERFIETGNNAKKALQQQNAILKNYVFQLFDLKENS